MAPLLIYCDGKSPAFAQIAVEEGFLYGVQAPAKVYHPPYFVDQDWKKPDRTRYMAFLAQHRPHIATVLDWEREAQLSEVLDWSEEAAQYVQQVVIIPKVGGGISRLPRAVAGKQIVLGYSVPTKYGGTLLPTTDFPPDWPVHLLGGSPHKQLQLADELHVASLDGNYAHKMAVHFLKHWTDGATRQVQQPREKSRPNRYWHRLPDEQIVIKREGALLAFRHSCLTVRRAWDERDAATGDANRAGT